MASSNPTGGALVVSLSDLDSDVVPRVANLISEKVSKKTFRAENQDNIIILCFVRESRE